MGSSLGYAYIDGLSEIEVFQLLDISRTEETTSADLIGVSFPKNGYLLIDPELRLTTNISKLLLLSKSVRVISGGFTDTSLSSTISIWSDRKELWRVEFDEIDGLYIGGSPPELVDQVLKSLENERSTTGDSACFSVPLLLFEELTGIAPNTIGRLIHQGSQLNFNASN